jgi:UDPglucose--hexose-1-phosphate uridylyltransferase
MSVNEFRQNPVSGAWVLVASERSKRPQKDTREPFHQTIRECLFEPSRLADQLPPVVAYSHGAIMPWRGDWTAPWTTVVIPNKFPALRAGLCGPAHHEGPYTTFAPVGTHELVITRDHEKSFTEFTTDETAEVLRAYRDRYRAIRQEPCGAYISIFHNHGVAAGASISHNHSQIISTPIIPPDVEDSIYGADRYFAQHHVEAYHVLIDWERREGIRLIEENPNFVALCPFASKAYEMQIIPKHTAPRFEDTGDAELIECADMLNSVLKKMNAVLGNPDYNFFIHTTPVTSEGIANPDSYRWHIEIVPRLPNALPAGLELATALYINPFNPDECAAQLRDIHV